MRCAICNEKHSPTEGCTPVPAVESASPSADGFSPTRITPFGLERQGGGVHDALVGSTVGSFKITRLLGRGGMGSVYVGEHLIIGSKVAIKFLHEHLSSNANLVQRFYAEARAVNLIGHANIVNIFDMNVLPSGRYYLVMEYLEGRPLGGVALPLSPHEALPVLLQVCEALEAAHNLNIVHRDLKPDNIVLVKRGKQENFVKILDFGIAKLFREDSGTHVQTIEGAILGTPEYMAPEQASAGAIDGRCDIYALGIIAYQLAVGETPFAHTSLPGLLLAHLNDVPSAPHTVNPSIPPAWSLAIMKALEKRPEARFQTAGAFGHALEEALSVKPLSPHGHMPGQPQAAPPQQTTAPPTQATASSTSLASQHARHQARFEAQVFDAEGKVLGVMPCEDVSRGGLFLCSETVRPPLFSRVTIALTQDMHVSAEVVRHVTSEQADAWKMSPGFGVQFVNLTATTKGAISKLIQGSTLHAHSPVPQHVPDFQEASQPLEAWSQRTQKDYYMLLEVGEDADFEEIRVRGRECKRELEALKNLPLSAKQVSMADAALQRIQAALNVVGHAKARLKFDSDRSNFRGVARCISAGLSVSELEEVRNAYLATRTATEGHARVYFLSGTALEHVNDFSGALSNYEKALQNDPLNLQMQQRYWKLRRQVERRA